MTTAPIRMRMGPAVARLRGCLRDGQGLLDAEEADIAAMTRARGQLARHLDRLEDYESQWSEIIAGLPEQARPAEEQIFMDFEQDGHHFTYWMESAREMMEQLDEELMPENPDAANLLALGGPALDGGQQPRPVQNGGQPEPVQNGGQPEPVQNGGQPEPVQNGGRPVPVQNGAQPGPAQYGGQPGIEQGGHAMVRLPQLAMPTFDGNPLHWPAFWQRFQSSVDRMPSTSSTTCRAASKEEQHVP